MKLKTLIGVTAALFLSAPAEALTWKEFWQPFVEAYNNPQYTTKKEVTCFKRVYSEEYVQGNSSHPGYVRHYRRRIPIPCGYHAY